MLDLQSRDHPLAYLLSDDPAVRAAIAAARARQDEHMLAMATRPARSRTRAPYQPPSQATRYFVIAFVVLVAVTDEILHRVQTA